jgi:hypothetical protein
MYIKINDLFGFLRILDQKSLKDNYDKIVERIRMRPD